VAAAPTTDQATRVRAQARYVRSSARKARLVLEHIRGKSYDQARATLAFTPRAAARDVLTVLESAGANSENNLELARGEFVVDAAYADEGPTLKRFRPRARGRAGRIHKRTCHVTVVLRHVPREEAPESASGGAAAATIEAESGRRRAKSRGAAAESAAVQGEAGATEAPAKPKRTRKRAAEAETTGEAEQAPAETTGEAAAEPEPENEQSSAPADEGPAGDEKAEG
jgi:large subunit ribosomal protein L22